MSRTDELIKEVRQILNDLETSLMSKRTELEDVKKYVLDAKQDLKDIEGQVETALREQQLTIEELEESIKPLKSEEQRLKGEIEALVFKKGDLKTENIQLMQSNEKFRKYEFTARKALQTKETSLVEREKAIRQKESLQPMNNSILPLEQ